VRAVRGARARHTLTTPQRPRKYGAFTRRKNGSDGVIPRKSVSSRWASRSASDAGTDAPAPTRASCPGATRHSSSPKNCALLTLVSGAALLPSTSAPKSSVAEAACIRHHRCRSFTTSTYTSKHRACGAPLTTTVLHSEKCARVTGTTTATRSAPPLG